MQGTPIQPTFRDTNRMANTLNKHIRVDEDDWKRIEQEAPKRGTSPNRLLITCTLDAIDGPRWPRTEAEIYLLPSAMFAAQAIARDMAAAGRGGEIEEIPRNISKVAPELPPERAADMFASSHAGAGET